MFSFSSHDPRATHDTSHRAHGMLSIVMSERVQRARASSGPLRPDSLPLAPTVGVSVRGLTRDRAVAQVAGMARTVEASQERGSLGLNRALKVWTAGDNDREGELEEDKVVTATTPVYVSLAGKGRGRRQEDQNIGAVGSSRRCGGVAQIERRSRSRSRCFCVDSGSTPPAEKKRFRIWQRQHPRHRHQHRKPSPAGVGRTERTIASRRNLRSQAVLYLRGVALALILSLLGCAGATMWENSEQGAWTAPVPMPFPLSEALRVASTGSGSTVALSGGSERIPGTASGWTRRTATTRGEVGVSRRLRGSNKGTVLSTEKSAGVASLVIGGNFTLNGKKANVAQYDPDRSVKQKRHNDMMIRGR